MKAIVPLFSFSGGESIARVVDKSGLLVCRRFFPTDQVWEMFFNESLFTLEQGDQALVFLVRSRFGDVPLRTMNSTDGEVPSSLTLINLRHHQGVSQWYERGEETVDVTERICVILRWFLLRTWPSLRPPWNEPEALGLRAKGVPPDDEADTALLEPKSLLPAGQLVADEAQVLLGSPAPWTRSRTEFLAWIEETS